MIGILDSGIGGLSIYKTIKDKYPDLGIVYFADKKNFPYGDKSEKKLKEITRDAVDTLINYGANIVIIACNSATVSTIKFLRMQFNVPIIGIEPAVKQAAKKTKSEIIGIMATKRTLRSQDSESLAPGQKLIKKENPRLVTRIENNYLDITDEELKESIQEYLNAGADSIVLGCTHYHFISDRLSQLFPDIKFYVPNEAILKRFQTVVKESNINLRFGKDLFLASAGLEKFSKSLNDLLEIKEAELKKI